ncbi:unnamed protein product [Dracunculus medinensis]|uniref:Uncharacterized protein n=1 Tax=Dracunculus medinensis TaxID=318479 RepID=A0A0N4UDK5_DRAME|nr:unnamed protein product [Dracunculus medinensis]
MPMEISTCRKHYGSTENLAITGYAYKRSENFVDNRNPSIAAIKGKRTLTKMLTKAGSREIRIEERLKEKMNEIHELENDNEKLLRKIQEIETMISKSSEKNIHDKRALMEEIVELQRRLDNLTPSLAKKLKMNEGKREESALSILEAERREEIEKLIRNIRKLEMELDEQKEKERSLIDELNTIKRSLREEQLRAKKDKAIAEKVTLDENNALIRENSEKSAEISRLEMTIEDLKKEFNLRRANEISPAEYAVLDDYQNTEVVNRESRSRMQNELDALRALSESLSNENKLLRQEKASINERCDELGNTIRAEETSLKRDFELLMEKNREMEKKIASKEDEISAIRRELRSQIGRNREIQNKLNEKDDELKRANDYNENIDKQYRQLLAQLEHETALQHEKSSSAALIAFLPLLMGIELLCRTNEYEKLAKRIRELSESIKEPRTYSAASFKQSLSAFTHTILPTTNTTLDSMLKGPICSTNYRDSND